MRAVRMSVAMILAGLLAGLSATFLGLVDAGREIDGSLTELGHEAAELHRATSDAMARKAPVDAINRPRTTLRRKIEGFPADGDRIVRRTAATPYLADVSKWFSVRMDLLPSMEPIDKAYGDYIEQTKQAQSDSRKSESAATLGTRLLDMTSEQLVQRIEDARDRTRQASASALNGLQLITFLSIGIAALVVGLTPDQYS